MGRSIDYTAWAIATASSMRARGPVAVMNHPGPHCARRRKPMWTPVKPSMRWPSAASKPQGLPHGDGTGKGPALPSIAAAGSTALLAGKALLREGRSVRAGKALLREGRSVRQTDLNQHFIFSIQKALPPL